MIWNLQQMLSPQRRQGNNKCSIGTDIQERMQHLTNYTHLPTYSRVRDGKEKGLARAEEQRNKPKVFGITPSK